MSDEGRRAREWRSMPERIERAARRAGPLLIGSVFLALLHLTWKTWADPVVDFGRELYVPWQITEGRVLYRDLAYHSGPLSPHVNALWFSLAGVSLDSLVRLNLAILLGALWLLHRMLREGSGRVAATLGGLVFLVLFAFGGFTGTGNYNWVCPYSHELVHGIALSLLAIFLVGRFAARGSRGYALAAGAAVGLALLTKIEVSAAGAAAAALGLALATRGAGRGPALRAWALFATGALLPPVAAAGLLALAMPAGEAVRGALGSWLYAFDARNLDQHFYRTLSGADDPLANGGRLLLAAAGHGLALAPAAGVALLCRRPGAHRAAVAAAVGLVWAAAFAWGLPHFPWDDWLRPLPLWLLLLFAVGIAGFLRRPVAEAPPDALGREVTRLALLGFAGLTLLRMVLNVRVAHYGFALAMTGTVVLAAALVDWLPQWIERRGGCGAVFATAVVVLWLGILAGHVVVLRESVGQKTVTVSAGADAFRADWRGGLVNEAVERIDARLAPDETLASFTDGEMLNYLTRRRSPIRYGNFIPQQVMIFGEQNMIEALRAAPPDLVAIVHKDTTEYGPRFFGRDYALDLSSWIERHYRPIAPPIGAPPMRDERFGIVLMQRRDARAP